MNRAVSPAWVGRFDVRGVAGRECTSLEQVRRQRRAISESVEFPDGGNTRETPK
jgi:hypothetical protein